MLLHSLLGNGQLGLGLTGDQVSPIQIVKWPENKQKLKKYNYTGENGLPFVSMVACGARHTCCVDRRGRLYTWGGSGGCMLGIPTDLAVDVSAVRHTSVSIQAVRHTSFPTHPNGVTNCFKLFSL